MFNSNKACTDRYCNTQSHRVCSTDDCKAPFMARRLKVRLVLHHSKTGKSLTTSSFRITRSCAQRKVVAARATAVQAIRRLFLTTHLNAGQTRCQHCHCSSKWSQLPHQQQQAMCSRRPQATAAAGPLGATESCGAASTTTTPTRKAACAGRTDCGAYDRDQRLKKSECCLFKAGSTGNGSWQRTCYRKTA